MKNAEPERYGWIGAVFLPVMASAYIGLSSRQIPHASVTTRIMQQIGGAFGASLSLLFCRTS
ncbi:multidrug efflux MFS transporter [Paenibacillus yonginensis]|uniref:multidrug efflux MFS transporter n=1 Tax=Paenibacillus yonginensis TaxID=1462996 RepID=UPI001245163C|nr:multidrug efflux MFS transporter [Paenibacillus yonginensis]